MNPSELSSQDKASRAEGYEAGWKQGYAEISEGDAVVRARADEREKALAEVRDKLGKWLLDEKITYDTSRITINGPRYVGSIPNVDDFFSLLTKNERSTPTEEKGL